MLKFIDEHTVAIINAWIIIAIIVALIVGAMIRIGGSND